MTGTAAQLSADIDAGSFGPDPKDVLDVFTADKGGGWCPVLISVGGGATASGPILAWMKKVK